MKLCLILFVLLASGCIPVNKEIKQIARDSWTGRFTKMFFEKDYNNSNLIKAKYLSTKNLRLLSTDLTYIVNLLRMANNKIEDENISKIAVKIKENEFPNVYVHCNPNEIYITTGLIYMVFQKAFESNFDLTNNPLFWNNFEINISNNDSQLIQFFNLLYEPNLKPVFIFTNDDILSDEFGLGNDAMNKLFMLQQTVSYCDNELFKTLIFIISHEFYHIKQNCPICIGGDKLIEIQADSFGLMKYLQFNLDRVAFDNLNLDFFTTFTGRSLQDIFFNIYKDIEIIDHFDCYIELDERIQMIKNYLNVIAE